MTNKTLSTIETLKQLVKTAEMSSERAIMIDLRLIGHPRDISFKNA